MPKYTVEAVKRIYLRTDVIADTREEAFKIVDENYIVDDFDEIGTDFTFTYISGEVDDDAELL